MKTVLEIEAIANLAIKAALSQQWSEGQLASISNC